MKKSTLSVLLTLICMLTFAEKNLNTGKIIEKGLPGYGPKLIVYDTKTSPRFEPSSSVLNEIYGLNSNWSFGLLKEETDIIKMKNYRFQQYYRGIPVEWAQCIVHTTAEQLFESINGEVLTSHEPVITTPAMTPEDAIVKATEHINAKVYMWQDAQQTEWLKKQKNDVKASFYPTPQLCYLKVPTENDYTYTLCYKMDIYAYEPMSRNDIYVDALTGEVVKSINKIHEGTAVTAYSGTQTITTKLVSTYLLENNKNKTYDLNKGTNYGAAVSFTDADDYWNNVNADLDQYATDAHWGTEKTLAYYLNVNGRNSLDNSGYVINSYVHYSTGYNNAAWDGSVVRYGDGSGTNTPFVAADIVGHEITHGLTQFTAGLIYEGEPGALNESFSDMIGTTIEFYAKPGSANWTIGEQTGSTVRNMADPNAYSHPDTYYGLYYFNTIGCDPNGTDECGVHTNSGVGNYWFYLLSQGGSGINDIGNTYNVTGIGITDAGKIAFRTLTNYLTNTSGYSDARIYSLKAAADLFGNCSSQYIAVANAWNAVGIGSKYGASSAPGGLFTDRINECTATLNWSDNSSSSFEVNYRKTGTSTWTTATALTNSYTVTGLLASTAYQWKVRSVCGAITSGFGNTVSFTTLSTATNPSSASSSNITTCSADITWTANGNQYVLYYKTSSSGTYSSVNVNYTNSYTLTGLNANTTYNYKVATQSGCQLSIPVTVYSFATASATAPTGIVAKKSACRLFVYCDYTSGVNYELEYRVQGSGTWISSTLYGNDTYRTIFNNVTVLPSTTYEYRVSKIYSGNGCTIKSSSSTFTTTTPANSSCSAPTNITTLTGSGGAQYFIGWDPPANATTFGFRYRYSSTGAYTNLYMLGATQVNIPTNVSNYLEVGVQSNCACSGSSQSTWTTQVYNPVACGNITIYDHFNTCYGVTAYWSLCTATYWYNFRYRVVGSPTWTDVYAHPNNIYHFTYSTLSAGTTYEWQVQNECINGTTNPYTPSKTFTTPATCTSPSGITSVNPTSGSITLQWNAVTPFIVGSYAANTSFGYVVRYRQTGSSTWLGNYTVLNNTITINGLTALTSYEFQVMTHCNKYCSMSSSWSSTYTASTTCSNCKEEVINTQQSLSNDFNVIVAPNPFDESIKIDYDIFSDETVEISITDLQGRILETIAKERMEKGHHEHIWQGSKSLSEGLYFLVVKTDNNKFVKRIVHQKN